MLVRQTVLLSFNLYYVKGILADSLSRHCVSDNHTTDLIPISFCCFFLFLLHKSFDTYHITTSSQDKAGGEVAHKVHGTDEALAPN